MFNGGGNMAGMMKKVQKMQADMKKMQDELREGCDLLHIRAVRAAGRGRSSVCPSPAPSCRPPFSLPR